ncbi:MAG: MerR family transcriptional regulator, partial [Oscillospiraceae bacterium]|nr:MerR family transcriptional regulator [Oscillospiraceae bacterium]
AYRLYDQAAVQRLEQILILRKLNISIRDIQHIFAAPDSGVVLEVLGQKVQNIDDEVALLHELKEVVLEFIQEIERRDFGDNADIKLLYEKAKDVETHLANVDYIGKPSNVWRLLEAAEKVEREPDILVVEMPPCRMVTSGYIKNNSKAEHKFDAMWMRLGSRVADKINARDFMYYDEKHKKSVWLYLLEDWMTKADTGGYKIITFPGGLFAVMLADSWELSEWDRVERGLKAWLSRQEHLALDEAPGRNVLFHYAGPHSAQMKEWNIGKIRYFVPIKIKEGH